MDAIHCMFFDIALQETALKNTIKSNTENMKEMTKGYEPMNKKPNLKLIIGVVVIVAALGYLLISATRSNTQYFMTVDELTSQKSELEGQKLRMSGAVVGESIQYNPATLDLSFVVAQIPGDHRLIAEMGGMAKVLADAVADPTAARMTIHYNGVKPDLLKDEAQAIVTGSLDAEGIFQATELLMKCPSKYESILPDQVED